METSIQIAGYKELQVALKLLAPKLHADLNSGMRAIVEFVAQDAVQWADRQGFTPPGRSGRGVGNLIGQIRSGVNQTKGYVKDTANRNGYYYPARYEYQSGGERAFLHPAIKQDEGKIIASIDAIVTATLRSFDER